MPASLSVEAGPAALHCDFISRHSAVIPILQAEPSALQHQLDAVRIVRATALVDIVRYKDTFFAQLARARIDELKKHETPPLKLNTPEQVVVATPPALPTKGDSEAARLKVSADQGNADAQSKLGYFYEFGKGGLTKDDREAARLYKLSADQGNAYGQFKLGYFYAVGRGGLTKDVREAARLYKLSADQGNAVDRSISASSTRSAEAV